VLKTVFERIEALLDAQVAVAPALQVVAGAGKVQAR
jgi:hypothetical protein